MPRLPSILFLPLFALITSCSAFGAPLRSPAEGGRRWLEFATTHFTLFTDLPAPDARATIADLETSVQALEQVAFPDERRVPLRVRVVAFESMYDYRAVSTWGTQGQYFDSRPGYLERCPTIVTVGPFTAETRAVAIHELVHAFVRRAYVWAPTWLDEGLAQYFSSLRIENGFVLLGDPIPGHVVVSSLIPRVRDIVAANRADFDGRIGTGLGDEREDLRRAGYYAGAWALVHMLRNGPDDYRRRFDRFIEVANDHAALSTAWEEVERDIDPDRFEHDFRTYIERGDWSLMSAGAPTIRYAHATAPRVMSDAEVKVLWAGLIRWQGEHVAEATRWLDDAAHEAPQSSQAHYWRGLIALHTERFATAISEEREALRLSPNAPDVMLALAVSLLRSARVHRGSTFVIPSEIEELGNRLETAARSGRQHAFVAELRLSQRRLEDAMAASGRSVAADPLSSACLATRAQALFAAGRFADAADTQERAIRYLPDGAVPKPFLEALARYRAAAARQR